MKIHETFTSYKIVNCEYWDIEQKIKLLPLRRILSVYHPHFEL